MIPYAGKNRQTVNYLKTVYFDTPEWTPCGSPSCRPRG